MSTTIAAPAVAAATAHKRRVNDLLLQNVYVQERSEPMGLVCECAASDCFATVWLSPAEYEGGRVSPHWSVLAPGHQTG